MTDNNKDLFVHWVNERESIRIKKENGLAKPWTRDKTMQEVYFCNVRREDDKTTRWIADNWRIKGNPHPELAMMTARIFNYPPTLKEIGPPEKDLSKWFTHMNEVLRNRALAGQPIWSGAYIISTNGRPVDKASHCLGMLRNASERMPVLVPGILCSAAHRALQRLDGLGSFLAAQIVADLKHYPGHPLVDADDWWRFSAHGPGSLRGLSWFFRDRITPRTYSASINAAHDIVSDRLCVKPISMQDLQNCFCEYDKYMRVKFNMGKSKRKYQGR